jgi:hypothetical protein
MTMEKFISYVEKTGQDLWLLIHRPCQSDSPLIFSRENTGLVRSEDLYNDSVTIVQGKLIVGQELIEPRTFGDDLQTCLAGDVQVFNAQL